MNENKQNLAESLADKFSDLPMLRIIFKSLIEDLQVTLRRDYNMPIDIDQDMVVPLLMTEYIKDIRSTQNSLVIEYKFCGWNVFPFYVVLSRRFIYKIIEFILGGDKIDYHLEIAERQFSKIEEDIISQLAELVSISIQNAFLLVESNIKIAMQNIYFDNNFILPDTGTGLLSKANLRLKNWDGFLDLIIPYESLLPIKTKLLKSFSNLKLQQQDEWRKHLYRSVSEMKMRLTVEIEVPQTLAKIQEMRVGDTIITDKNASESFEIKINGRSTYNCKIGKLSDNIAVEITDFHL